MISKTKITWTKFIKPFVLICLVFSFSAMAQTTNDKPMEAKALANMIKEFTEIVSKNAPDKNEAKLVIEKWDKRTDLAGKSKEVVANLLYEDVKSVIEDYGIQYQISTMFSFYLTIPDKFLSDLDKKNESEKSATDVSKLPADITDWGGQDSDKILENPAIKMRLKKLLGDEDFESFSDYFETPTPIEKSGNVLFASGCMIRACTRLESAVAINLINNTIHAAIYNKIEETKYFNEKNSKTPEAIIKWAKRLEDLKKDVEDKPEAILIDSFSYTNREDMMARVDNYVVESQNKPTTSAYIIIRGNNAVRTKTEKELTEYITQNRGLDKNRLFILNADGDKTAEIELWLVPPGAKAPTQEKSADQAETDNKPQAVLNTEFRFENCESLMAQFDSFSVSMQNDPNAAGYIILNGKQRTRTNTAQQIREYIKMRRLDFNRYMFLNGDGDSSVVIEFWLVPNGAVPPVPKKVVDETSEKFEMPTEPFVYTEKFSYAAFGCTAPLDVEGYASILDEYPKSRGNIVIYERSKRIFRQKEKEILAQLTKRGIARKRLKTFFKLVDSEAPNEGIKLWILP